MANFNNGWIDCELFKLIYLFFENLFWFFIRSLYNISWYTMLVLDKLEYYFIFIATMTKYLFKQLINIYVRENGKC